MLQKGTLVIVAIAVALVVTAAAQPCADWSETMPPPNVFPNLAAPLTILLRDEYEILVDDSLFVCDLDTSPPSILGRCDVPDYSEIRIRELDGEVYLACGPFGIAHVDLGNVAFPTCSVVYSTGDIIRDLATFDGGVVLVTEPGAIIVVDGLLDNRVELYARIDTPDDLRSVVARGSRAWVAGNRGVAGVDLTDPAMPVVGERQACESIPDLQARFYDLVLRGDYLYSNAFYSAWWYHGDAYLQEFAIDESLDPIPVSCRVTGRSGRIAAVSGLLVATHFGGYVAFYQLPGLAPIGTATLPRHCEYPRAIAIDDAGSRLFVSGAGSWFRVARYVRVPHLTVAPHANLPQAYNPSGCGRFGFVSYSYQEPYGPTYYLGRLYDQSSPVSPELIESWLFSTEYHSNSSAGFGLIAQNDRWAITSHWFYYDDWQYGENYLYATSENGETFLLDYDHAANAVVADNIVWVVERDGSGDSLEAFDLSGNEPVWLGQQTFEMYSLESLYVIGDLLLSFTDHRVNVHDISDPAAIEFVGFLALDVLPSTVVHVEAPYLYVGFDAGLVVLDVDPASSPPVRELARIDLAYAPKLMAKHGGLLAVGGSFDGWQIVSVADPIGPFPISPVMPEYAFGFAWSGTLLYVGVSGTGAFRLSRGSEFGV